MDTLFKLRVVKKRLGKAGGLANGPMETPSEKSSYINSSSNKWRESKRTMVSNILYSNQ